MAWTATRRSAATSRAGGQSPTWLPSDAADMPPPHRRRRSSGESMMPVCCGMRRQSVVCPAPSSHGVPTAVEPVLSSGSCQTPGVPCERTNSAESLHLHECTQVKDMLDPALKPVHILPTVHLTPCWDLVQGKMDLPVEDDLAVVQRSISAGARAGAGD